MDSQSTQMRALETCDANAYIKNIISYVFVLLFIIYINKDCNNYQKYLKMSTLNILSD